MTQNKTNRRETLAGIAVVASLATTKGWAMTQDQEQTLSAAFDLEEIARLNAASDGPWFQFFDNNTMFSGLYEIPAGGEDRQNPHRVDELYFVTKGKAALVADDKRYPAKPGSIFFVKADVAHKFVDVEEDLQVLVFFSKADPNGA
ncbi:MAG: cupin domain-containing protein [Pseudomonadota bacterium]